MSFGQQRFSLKSWKDIILQRRDIYSIQRVQVDIMGKGETSSHAVLQNLNGSCSCLNTSKLPVG